MARRRSRGVVLVASPCSAPERSVLCKLSLWVLSALRRMHLGFLLIRVLVHLVIRSVALVLVSLLWVPSSLVSVSLRAVARALHLALVLVLLTLFVASAVFRFLAMTLFLPLHYSFFALLRPLTLSLQM